MLTFISIMLIIAAIFIYIWQKQRNFIISYNEKTKDPYYHKDVPMNIGVKPYILLIVGVLIFMLNGVFFWANAGTVYAVQYPWGGDKMIKTQGLKTKYWGRTIPISYEISIQDKILRISMDNGVANEETLDESTDGIYNRKARRWEFSDAIKADIGTAIIIGVDTNNEELFLNMADRNRSESKLIYGRVLPNVDAALKNTCKLMDAQEYISGKASDFDRYFRDQLENGMYLVEEYFEEESLPEIIGDTTTVRIINPVAKSSKQKRYRIMKDAQGNVLRDVESNSLKQYGIEILQAQVTSIDWEQSFDERLDLQKDEVAKTQLEKQEAERQFYTAKKEIAAGEAAKAKERARLEKDQIQKTIEAETQAKVAEQNEIAERRILSVNELKAKSQKVLADAQAYENRMLVSAGLTPQEKAELELKKADVISRNLAGPQGLRLPSTVIGSSGGGKENNLLESLIGAKLAEGMISN